MGQRANLDSVQVERIAKTCQLWGHSKYFYPCLDDDDIDWEGAFIENIDDVLAAENKDKLAEVKPTIAGISQGKDEVLEKTIEYLEDIMNE